MAKEDQSTPSTGDYINHFIFKTDVGIIGLVVSGILIISGTYSAGSRVMDHYFPEKKEIIQQNAIGNTQPDIYIEKDGVKYFSHIDGKDISDLVKP